MNRLVLSALLALPLANVACKKSESSSAAKPTEVAYELVCNATVSKIATEPPVEGAAQGPDQARATADAWAQACGKLPAAAQAGCGVDGRAPSGWSQTGGGGGEVNGAYSATITLAPLNRQESSRSTSEVSEDEACAKALADVCAKLGAAKGCETAAGFSLDGINKTRLPKQTATGT